MTTYRETAQLIKDRGKIVAFTGAGISVDAGIPAFRGAQGLWERYDPAEYADIRSFMEQPAKVWGMLREMTRLIFDARPSPAHLALAELERAGLLDAIVTQNVDGLHQAAGNTDVIEYHGNSRYLVCLSCGERTPFTEEALRKLPYPICLKCRTPLKPDGVFFGEQIPLSAVERLCQAAQRCKIMMIIGTSGTVYPAADLPFLAASNGAAIVEINLSPTPFTAAVSRYFLKGSASRIMPRILDEMGLRIESFVGKGGQSGTKQ